MYAMVSWFGATWKGASSAWSCLWMLVALVVGVGSELGQLAGVVPGTFDTIDVVFYLLGWSAAFIRVMKRDIWIRHDT